MSCTITYKGKQYSDEEFEEYFRNNIEEFSDVIDLRDLIGVKDSPIPKNKNINRVFNFSRELQQIGTKEQYAAYLETIFPNSRLKNVMFHGGTVPEEGFKKGIVKATGAHEFGEGFYFGATEYQANYYVNMKKGKYPNSSIYAALLDIQDPYYYYSDWGRTDSDPNDDPGMYIDGEEYQDSAEATEAIQGLNKDAVITLDSLTNPEDNIDEFTQQGKINGVDINIREDGEFGDDFTVYEIVVFEPEQIHILDSDKDRAAFKDFVQNSQDTEGIPKLPLSRSFAVYNGADIFDKNLTKDLDTGKYHAPNGDIYDSITGDLIPSIQSNPYVPENDDTVGTRQAKRKWKANNLKDDDTIVDEYLSPVPLTMEQYAIIVDDRFERGRAKGEILHLKIHEYINKDPQIALRIDDLYESSGIFESEMDWVTPTAIRNIIRRTSVNTFSDQPTDRLLSEQVISSDILKVAGTIDLVADFGDDIYGVYDLKTGLRFNKIFEDSFFKYGRTSSSDVFDTARNRAKLQIMLYAFLMKAKQPNARFRELDVIHVRNQWSIKEHDPYKSVNVPAYLEIIQKTLQAERPKEYAELEDLPHFAQLFDPASYMAVMSDQFEGNHPKASSADLIRDKMLKLQELIMFDRSIADINSGTKQITRTQVNGKEVVIDEVATRRQKISALMQEIITLKQDPSVNMSVSDVNMGWLDRYLGSQSYSTNPYVQMYYKELSKAKQKSRDNYEKIVQKHDSLLKKVISDMGLKPLSRLVGGVDRTALFDFAYKTDEKHIKRLVTEKDTVEFNKLLPSQQEYLRFINNSMSGVFQDQYASMIDPDNLTPLAKRVVTYRNWRDRKDIEVTNMDLYNKKYSINNSDPRKDQFEYYEGFFPKFAPQIDDIARMHGGYFTPAVVKFLWAKYSTNYFESQFDQWENNDEAIPMKYLGGEGIDADFNYTVNLELAYKSFMKHHIYKAQMDEVYSMAQALKIYLDAKNTEIRASGNDDQSEHVKRLIDWFEDSINLHILGRKQTELTVSGRGFGRIHDGRYKKFNWTKFLRSMKSFFAGPTMWLKPLTSLPNAVFASLVTIKEGIKGSLGISTSNAKFTLGDMAAGFAEGFKLVFWDGTSNDAYRNNKAYLLMEKFGYLTDNHDWYTSNNELLTARNQLFTSKSMLMFHTLPEEAIATAIFVAQMKAMKFTKADGTETNMWDAYEVEETKLSDGTTHSMVEWKGGKRGLRNMSNLADKPDYVEVEGMTTEEINAVKFLYEKIHGGYRGDERTAAEYYVVGELFLQMKRYMPAILKNVWASKGVRQTQGYFEEVEDANGQKVLKWKPQVIEGRYKTLLGLLFNYLSIKQNTTDGPKTNFIKKFLGIQYDDSQAWDKLSDAQKEDVKDFLLTTTMFFLLLIGYMKLWDRGDDDTLKKIYGRVVDDFAGNVNPRELIKNIKNAGIPTSVNRAYQLTEGTAELLWSSMLYAAGYDDAALTKEGNFRGAAAVKRNIHFISSIYDLNTKLENAELYQEYLRGN